MKMYGGVELFLTSALDVGEFSASRFTPRGQPPSYILSRKLGGPHCRSRRSGEEKLSLYELLYDAPSSYNIQSDSKLLSEF
jgi:hypothetical protein